MDPFETVTTRCQEIGLEDEDADTGATIARARRAPGGPSLVEGLPVDLSGSTLPELPRISVDLQLPDTRASLGAKVGRDLEVTGMLGQGGMGRVLLARQHSLNREVAIKTLHDTSTPKDRAALLAEGAITGHLEHPAIIPVHALGVDAEGSPVLVMKRVEGVEWSALLRDPAHPGWGDDHRDRLDAHLEILMQVSNAVQFAHSRGIVHRDIKPSNVLIGRYGEVYLCDWGIAARTDREWRPEPLCGTPAYMAPEMIVGGSVDARTDVYLLGATLHHILTGKPRNAGLSTREALLGAVGPVLFDYPPSVPEELAALANRATAHDPEQRPASALELRQAIADYLLHKSSIALAQSAAERLGRLRALVADEAALRKDETQRVLDQLVAEAGFALDQALRQWSENRVAARARAELEELLSWRRARAAELERLARELDPRVSRRQRALAFAGVAVAGLGLSITGITVDQREVTPRLLLYQSLAPLAILALIVAFLRRHALRTAFNRRVTLLGAAVVGGVTASRALGLLAGVEVPHILIYDQLLVGLLSAMGAVLLIRWLAWSSLVMFAAAFVAALSPDHAMLTFWLATDLALVGNVGFAWKSSAGAARRAPK